MSGLESFVELALDPLRPVALLADIHANIEALAMVVEWLDARSVSQAIVLGDAIGYGASPAAVVDLLEDRGWAAIRGNHEDMLGDLSLALSRGNLKPAARRSIEWTRQQVGPEWVQRLASLPLAARLAEATLAVHGSVADSRRCYAYTYDLSIEINRRALRSLGAPAGALVLHGHTHRPCLFVCDQQGFEELDGRDGTYRLPAANDCFLNPGSVGLPRDGDQRAAFAILEVAARSVRFVRLEYDVATAAARIRRAGYGDEIAERLLRAR